MKVMNLQSIIAKLMMPVRACAVVMRRARALQILRLISRRNR
ncbi:hypothetical protein [Thalassolituus marinus]|nr:hypothetical protein [Thalassolituus marinus]